MTTNLECRLGVVSLGLDAGLARLSELPRFIHDGLSYFSHGDINLAVTNPKLMPGAELAGRPASALQLHNQLLAVNQNPPNGPLQRICLLFAHSYSGLKGALGIMFDRGFATIDDPNTAPIYLARPRQGCAVFLGQIAEARSADQFAPEVFFVAMHELGHLFNLQHDETSLNFMKTSDEHQAYGPPSFHYTPFHQSRLERCSTDPYVMPGSSVFDAGGATNFPAPAPAPLSKSLKLELAMHRTSFWRFEPVQIEIGLSLGGVRKRPLSVPALLDPSHGRFRLMIENDRGERSLYRSPYRVCGGSDMLTITPESPYRRDFPIFGQSGGYTFNRAGRHIIRAELDVGHMRLQSNEVAVEVQREVGLTASERALQSTLCEPSIGRLLFHREDAGDHLALRKLARYVKRVPDIPPAGDINYALARAALRQPGAQAVSKVRDRARHWLDRTLASSDVGPHLRQRATRMLQDLENSSSRSRAKRRTATYGKPPANKKGGIRRRKRSPGKGSSI